MTGAHSPSKEFQAYTWFSVQVDQYYAAIRVLARHHNALSAAYSHLPRGEDWPKDVSCLNQAAKEFLVIIASTLNHMGATGIFQEVPYKELNNLSTDIINFGFYTCFTFQWTLFENFIKDSVAQIASINLLPKEIARELKKRELRTYQFLKYIDDGHVFGHTPFTTVLPKPGWMADFEKCDFSDLNDIREQRNRFIHAVDSTTILPIEEPEKDRMYERSMWILRQFAGNLDQDIGRLMLGVSAK